MSYAYSMEVNQAESTPMTDPYRVVCAELVDDLEMSDWPSKLKEVFRADIARARTLLAEPEAEGPSSSDVTELFYRHMGEGSEVGFENAIAEALSRWGRPAAAPVPEPEPVVLVKQHIFPTPSQAAECGGPCYEGSYCPEACDCGLYRSPTPQPVADGGEGK